MKYLVLLLAFCLMSCKNDVKAKTETTSALLDTNNEELEIYDFNGFKPFLEKQDDKVYVVNFWATWCKPCVKELPYFEKLNETYKDKNVEVILVSLDFPHLYDKKLKPYIKEHNLQSKLVALDDPDMNSWIPKVSESWSGSIPATIIYNKDLSKFYERSFTFQELEEELHQFLN